MADCGYLECERAAVMRASYALVRRLIDAPRVVCDHARDLGPPDRGSREFIYLAQRISFGATALSDCMEYAGSIREYAPPPARSPTSGLRSYGHW